MDYFDNYFGALDLSHLTNDERQKLHTLAQDRKNLALLQIYKERIITGKLLFDVRDAIRDRSPEQLERCRRAGQDIAGTTGCSNLLVAAMNEPVMIAPLLELGADPNSRGVTGNDFTPLEFLVMALGEKNEMYDFAGRRAEHRHEMVQAIEALLAKKAGIGKIGKREFPTAYDLAMTHLPEGMLRQEILTLFERAESSVYAQLAASHDERKMHAQQKADLKPWKEFVVSGGWKAVQPFDPEWARVGKRVMLDDPDTHAIWEITAFDEAAGKATIRATSDGFRGVSMPEASQKKVALGNIKPAVDVLNSYAQSMADDRFLEILENDDGTLSMMPVKTLQPVRPRPQRRSDRRR